MTDETPTDAQLAAVELSNIIAEQSDDPERIASQSDIESPGLKVHALDAEALSEVLQIISDFFMHNAAEGTLGGPSEEKFVYEYDITVQDHRDDSPYIVFVEDIDLIHYEGK